MGERKWHMDKIKKQRIPDLSEREKLLHQIERITELPLLILAFAMVPLLLGPVLWELSPSQEAVFLGLQILIWAIFAVDMIVKVLVSPQRGAYIRSHWLEVIIVALPLLRPLRLLRLIVFGSRAWVGVRRLVHIDFLFVYGIGLVTIASTVVLAVEHGVNVTIQSFPNALWWAMATITTVGYGDVVPVTGAGRAVGFVLMLGGIAFFSGITANLASLLLREHDPRFRAIVHLTEQVEALRKEMSVLHGRSGPEPQ
ncbi:MAG: potassium channel family protein [Dehalococcoidia bacterium]|nr:potassium channel family protein [Dehalococcoidia bacterium]